MSTCGRCERETSGEFCADCVDRCHESTELGHTCKVCAAPPVVGTVAAGPIGVLDAALE